MMKDVKMLIKRCQPFKIFILIIGTFIFRCDKSKKIYLDYIQVIFHSSQKYIMQRNSSFIVYNEEGVIHFYRTEKEARIRPINYLEKIKITPIDTAITRLSKITIDNFRMEKEKGLLKIFIVKKDTLNNELKIIEIGQSFVISEDNFEIR